ncbi:MAG TPA: hypothetical protein VIU61_11410 [Kofleriaceae bacterium]
MGSDDLTVRILIEIRDEIRATNARIDGTNERVDALGSTLGARIDTTNARIDQLRTELHTEISSVREDLGNRITGVELNLATQMTALIGSTRDLHDMLADRFDLRDRVERCERAIDDLNRRVD